ncbi:MAG: glycosyl hydrolase [Agathobacter sp.]
MITTPCNKNAIPEVHKMLAYFSSLEGKGILTGQHTQTRAQEELLKIHEITGKLPALCGFELLSYSPNIRLETCDEACITEVEENRDTLKQAWEWIGKGGLITFTWHWYSPLSGRDKSFYTSNTDFDASLALIEGTPENLAMRHDLDHMAELLQPFCDQHIPILWRPFHEADGSWFWWGAKGPEVAKGLYHYMYHYYTEQYHLDNLIWVWNSPKKEYYVGDGFCDIISVDQYPPKYSYSDFRDTYLNLIQVTNSPKGAAIAETGIIPDAQMLESRKTPWLWYMTWSKGFVLTEEFNQFEALRRLYHHSYAITLDRLPKLY